VPNFWDYHIEIDVINTI